MNNYADIMYNREHYPDPTAYEAFRHMLNPRKRRLVYICSPYSGDVEFNTENARRWSRCAVDRGVIPVTPHLLYPQFLDDNDSYERMLGLDFGLALLDKCAEVWVFGNHISAGMKAELDHARMHGKIIRYFGRY